MFNMLLTRFARPPALADGIGDAPRLQQSYSSQFQQLDRAAGKATEALKGAHTTADKQEVLSALRDSLVSDGMHDTNNEKELLKDVAELIDKGTPESLDKASKWLFGIVHDQKEVLTKKVEALRDPAKASEMLAREKIDLKMAKDELKEVTDQARAYIGAHMGKHNAPDKQVIRKNAEEINALRGWVAEKELEATEGEHIKAASHTDPRAQDLAEALRGADFAIDDVDLQRGLKTFQQKAGLPPTGQLDRKTFDKLAEAIGQNGNSVALAKLVDASRQEAWFVPGHVKADHHGATIQGMDNSTYKITDAGKHLSLKVDGDEYQLDRKPPTIHPHPGKARPLTADDLAQLRTRLEHLSSQVRHVVDSPDAPPKDKAAAQQVLDQVKKLRGALPQPGGLIDL